MSRSSPIPLTFPGPSTLSKPSLTSRKAVFSSSFILLTQELEGPTDIKQFPYMCLGAEIIRNYKHDARWGRNCILMLSFTRFFPGEQCSETHGLLKCDKSFPCEFWIHLNQKVSVYWIARQKSFKICSEALVSPTVDERVPQGVQARCKICPIHVF